MCCNTNNMLRYRIYYKYMRDIHKILEHICSYTPLTHTHLPLFLYLIPVNVMKLRLIVYIPGPDPGFSVGGAWTHFGGFWPPTWALFSKNVFENERIGSCRGASAGTPPPPQIRLCIPINHTI